MSTKQQWVDMDTCLLNQVKGNGIKMFVEHEFASLRAVAVGDPSSLWFLDVDTDELQRLTGEAETNEWYEMHRRNKLKPIKDVDPERYEKLCFELDALTKAYRDAGIHVIRNETGQIPDEILNFRFFPGGQHCISPYGGKQWPNTFGSVAVQFHENSRSLPMQHVYRATIAQLMSEPQNSDAVWLTMPVTPPNPHRQPSPTASPGDPRLFPEKRILFGMGIPSAGNMSDPSVATSAADPLGIDLFRRMLKPYGFEVESFFYNSKYSYHCDSVLCMIDEGLLAYPHDLFWPDQELPKELRKYDAIHVDPDELKKGACNSISLGNKRIIITDAAPKLINEVEKRGIDVIRVPFGATWDTYGGGLHCASGHVWQED